mgnify:CR=1 FL=1
MIKIVADENIPFLRGVFENLADISFLPAGSITNKEIKNADCLIIRTRTKCDRELLEGTRVKFIATTTIGYEHIDTEYCRDNGIKWTNAPGCNANSVNQYVAAALSLYSKEKEYHLRGKKIGIIGVGRVGKLVMETSRQLGMIPLANDPPRERTEGKGFFVNLDLLLSESDIISLHVPLTMKGAYKTYHLADEEFFSKARHSALFINTARGPVMDTGAIAGAIDKGIIKDAIIDVWENEPLLPGSLLKKTFIGTPHIAGYSVDGKARGTAMAVRSVGRFFGLGLEKWHPSALPGKKEKTILLEKEGYTDELIRNAILSTYKIEEDSNRLKRSPGEFEQQRNNYPVRREFGYYQIKTEHPDHQLKKRLSALGFRI